MTGNQTATVETLTAEVRVLMVGSRQVTMSVYGQLDHVEHGKIEPFGRVMPKDAQHDFVYVIGKRIEGGDLVSSSLPATEPVIKRWITGRSSRAAYERSAEYEDGRAIQCEDEARKHDENLAKLLGDNVGGANYFYARAAEHDQEAAPHEQEASLAEDESSRLTAVAAAANDRLRAIDAKEKAENARAKAAALQVKAQDARTQKAVHEANSTAHRKMRDMWADWEGEQTPNVIAAADEWEALPLIVLAGLR